MCHSSTHPGTSLHVTQFYQSFPALVLQAINAGVRRPGYEATLNQEVRAARRMKLPAFIYLFGMYTISNVCINSSVRCTSGVAATECKATHPVFGLDKNQCHLPPTVVFRSADGSILYTLVLVRIQIRVLLQLSSVYLLWYCSLRSLCGCVTEHCSYADVSLELQVKLHQFSYVCLASSPDF